MLPLWNSNLNQKFETIGFFSFGYTLNYIVLGPYIKSLLNLLK